MKNYETVRDYTHYEAISAISKQFSHKIQQLATIYLQTDMLYHTQRRTVPGFS